MRQSEPGAEGFVRPRQDFVPAYLSTYESGELERRVETGLQGLSSCTYCPRRCGVDRSREEHGVCHSSRHAEVASAFPHFGEESCLSGSRGSGTIFFSWCNLRCVFCQNFDISWQGEGQNLTAEQIASLMLQLQREGCHNINLVTPEHVVPQVLEAVFAAVAAGLRLPIVYNTSAYDALESLELLDGVVDVYMPDFKIWDSATARRLLQAEDYPERARQAIRRMHEQVGDLLFDEQGLALRGLLVRHLVMPNRLAGSGEIMRFLVQEISPHTYVNLMDQYRPAGRVMAGDERYADIARRPTASEYEEAMRAARQAGIHRFDKPWRAQGLFL